MWFLKYVFCLTIDLIIILSLIIMGKLNVKTNFDWEVWQLLSDFYTS